jgi:glucose-1-phosphate adenylyltransferase
MNVNATGRITDFEEKPEHPQSLLDAHGYCLASMGNYVFDTQSLVACLAEDAEKDTSSHDFGKDVIPKMILCSKVVAHRFRDSQDDQIPYWRDVGTLDSYWQSHMELLAHPDWLPLDNPNWPMWGQDPIHNTSTLVTGTDHQACEISKSRLHTNCQLSGCTIFQSALSKGCKINPGANIDSCVLLPEVVIESGVQMSRVIVDKGCVIPKNTDLTDPDKAFRQGFTVTNKGVILVTQSMINESQRKTLPIHPDLHSLDPISIPLDDVYLSKRQIFFK